MLEQVFASKTRARLLEALMGAASDESSMRELIRRVGTGASSVQRELERLERAGIVRSRRVGNARVFSADPAYPLHRHLRALVSAASCPPVGVSFESRPEVEPGRDPFA